MQFSSRFTIAIHIFACIHTFEKEHKITSDFLAASVNVNPVIIRKLLAQRGSLPYSGAAAGPPSPSRRRQSPFWMFSGRWNVWSRERFFIFMKTPIRPVR